MDNAVGANTTDFVAENTFEGTLQKLLQHGFHSSILPMEVGGEIDYPSYVHEWIRGQITVEDASQGRIKSKRRGMNMGKMNILGI